MITEQEPLDTPSTAADQDPAVVECPGSRTVQLGDRNREVARCKACGQETFTTGKGQLITHYLPQG